MRCPISVELNSSNLALPTSGIHTLIHPLNWFPSIRSYHLITHVVFGHRETTTHAVVVGHRQTKDAYQYKSDEILTSIGKHL